LSLQVVSWFATEFNLSWVGILSNVPVVDSHTRPTWIHLLRVDSILRVKILDLTIGEDPIELVIDFELGPELGS
jgi:hypothetical protein